MSASTTRRLGQPGDDAWGAFFGGGFVTQVDLLTDEIPLHAWDVAVSRSWWASAWGVLYLTTQRLVWIRWRFAAPWVRKTIDANLESVSGVGVQRRLSHGLAQVVTVALRDGGELLFWPPTYGSSPRRIAGEIVKVLRERGLLDD